MEKITLDGVDYKTEDFNDDQKVLLQHIVYHNTTKQTAQRTVQDSSLLLDHYIKVLKESIEAKKKKDDDKKE